MADNNSLLGYAEQANTVKFYNQDGIEVGILYVENPIRFEGKVDESAKSLFQFIVVHMDNILKELGYIRNSKI